jgi:hypothetical protein
LQRFEAFANFCFTKNGIYRERLAISTKFSSASKVIFYLRKISTLSTYFVSIPSIKIAEAQIGSVKSVVKEEEESTD